MAISRLALSAILAAGLCVGCGKGRTPAYPTEGQLLIGGKPAVNVFVLFHPVNATGPGVLRPSATTDADGKFRLTTYDAYDGAPAGDYVITLLYEPVNSPLFRAKGKPPKVPAEYTKMETSRLRATVVAQPDNVVEPINLP